MVQILGNDLGWITAHIWYLPECLQEKGNGLRKDFGFRQITRHNLQPTKISSL